MTIEIKRIGKPDLKFEIRDEYYPTVGAPINILHLMRLADVVWLNGRTVKDKYLPVQLPTLDLEVIQ